MKRSYRIICRILFYLFCIGFVWDGQFGTLWAAHSLRIKRYPLSLEKSERIIRELRSGGFPEVGLLFEMETTNINDLKKTKKQSSKISGKLFAKIAASEHLFRVELGTNIYLSTQDRKNFSKGSASFHILNQHDTFPNQQLLPPHLLVMNDLLMPFLQWDAEYYGMFRAQGRHAHRFRFSCAGKQVDVIYDASLGAVLQIEYFSSPRYCLIHPQGEIERTFKLLSFKKIKHTWLMKAVEIEDYKQKLKTRINFKQAAVEQKIPDDFFDKASALAPINDKFQNYAKM